MKAIIMTNMDSSAFFVGAVGGGATYFLQIMNTNPEFLKLIFSVVAAFLCGFAGVAGKYSFNKAKDWWYKRQSRKAK